MLKKLFVIGIVGLVGAYIVTETKAGSRIRDWVSRQCSKLEKKNTPDEELGRIKKEVKLLDGDIEKVKGDLAEANVSVRDLRADVERLRSEHKEADALARKHGDVMKAASNSDRIQWGGTTLAFADAKEKWAREVGTANRIKQQLASAETSLANQEKTRDLIEQQFHEMRRQKDELTQAVADMEAELKLAKIEQMRSKYQNDGTRMAEIKSSLTELRKRINVQREKLIIDARLHRNPVEDRSVDEIFADLDGKPIKRQPIDDEVKIVNRP
jgi:chromosome segregation ATPase